MGLEAIGIGGLVLGALGLGQSAQAASQQRKQSKAALRQAEEQAAAAEAASRRQDSSPADLTRIQEDIRRRSTGRGGSTLITGPQGVNPDTLSLSASSLLGS